MDNFIAGTPSSGATDIYAEQNLTTQRLDGRDATGVLKTCSACNLIPTPHWAYGACSREQLQRRPPVTRKFFTGRAVGDFRMTESSELVNVAGHFVPLAAQRAASTCEITRTAAERGVGWQSYNSTNF